MPSVHILFGGPISMQEQWLTAALLPFQGYFYYHYEDFCDYLQTDANRQSWPEQNADQFYDFLKKGINSGVLQQANSQQAFLKVHPLFRYYAQPLWTKEQPPPKRNKAFCHHYFQLAKDLYQRLTTENEASFIEAIQIIDYEIENLTRATLLATKLEDQMLIFTGVLHHWYRHHHQLETALSFYKRIYDKLKTEQVKQLPLMVNIIGLIGASHMELRQFEKARGYFQSAIQICERPAFAKYPLKNELIVGFYANLGTCSLSRKAEIGWYRKSLQLAEHAQLADTTISQIAYNLSEILFQDKNYHESRTYLEKVLQIVPILKDPFFRVKIFRSTAMHALLTDDFTKAENALLEALAITRAIENHHLTGVLQQELAALCFKKEAYHEAERYCQEALALHIHNNDQYQQANALNLLAVIAFKSHNLADGMTYVKAAITEFNELKAYGQMAQAFTNIALTCFEIEWYTEGLTELEKAIFLLQKIEEETSLHHAKLLASCFLIELGYWEEAEQDITEALHYFDQVSDKCYRQFALNAGTILLEQQHDPTFENLIQEFMAKWQLVPHPDISTLLLSGNQLTPTTAHDRD